MKLLAETMTGKSTAINGKNTYSSRGDETPTYESACNRNDTFRANAKILASKNVQCSKYSKCVINIDLDFEKIRTQRIITSINSKK